MAKYCTNCGAVLEDDAVFCPECGMRTDYTAEGEALVSAGTAAGPAAASLVSEETIPSAAPSPEAIKAETAETVKAEQVQQTAPPIPPAPSPVKEELPERSKEISTAGYFWLMLLYAIPILGFIAMLIFGLAARNKNLRNHARAHLVWIIVIIVVSVLLYLTIRIALKAAGVEIDWETLMQNIRDLIPVN